MCFFFIPLGSRFFCPFWIFFLSPSKYIRKPFKDLSTVWITWTWHIKSLLEKIDEHKKTVFKYPLFFWMSYFWYRWYIHYCLRMLIWPRWILSSHKLHITYFTLIVSNHHAMYFNEHVTAQICFYVEILAHQFNWCHIHLLQQWILHLFLNFFNLQLSPFWFS